MKDISRTEFKQVALCLGLALLCFYLAACKTGRLNSQKERHPCNVTPPEPYPSWCLGTHRALPDHVKRLYPPSPAPSPTR